MDLSLKIPTSSSSSSPLLFSPFNPNPLRIQSLKSPRTSLRRRFRLSASTSPEPTLCFPLVIVLPKELTVPQKIVDALPPPARLASYVVFTGAALAAGFGLGFRFGGSRDAGIGGASVLGVASGAVVYGFNKSVPEVAAVSLHNLVADYDDPRELKKEEVEAIVEKLVRVVLLSFFNLHFKKGNLHMYYNVAPVLYVEIRKIIHFIRKTLLYIYFKNTTHLSR